MLDSPFKYIRVGIIVPRYGHKAVARNLVKRRLRELTRTLLLPIRASKNVVVRCKPSVYDCSFEDLVQQMSSVRAALMGGDSAKSEQ
jgi:ribonuclease P protein component